MSVNEKKIIEGLKELELFKFFTRLENLVTDKYLKKRYLKSHRNRNEFLLVLKKGNGIFRIRVTHDSFKYTVAFNLEDRTNRTGWINPLHHEWDLYMNARRLREFEGFLNKRKMKKIERSIAAM